MSAGDVSSAPEWLQLTDWTPTTSTAWWEGEAAELGLARCHLRMQLPGPERSTAQARAWGTGRAPALPTHRARSRSRPQSLAARRPATEKEGDGLARAARDRVGKQGGLRGQPCLDKRYGAWVLGVAISE